MGDSSHSTPKWILIATGVLGLIAASFVVLTNYFNLQKARIEAERAQTGDSRPVSVAATPLLTTQPASTKSDASLRPGLLVREYPRHKLQEGESGFVDVQQLGDPIGEPRVIRNLNEWRFTETRNAVASGFLKIEAPGDYAFASDNFYDRNALYVGDRLVCEFRDFQRPTPRIKLKAGLIPIQSVGYIGARGSVRVTWIFPGERELKDIPQELLFHTDPEAVR